MNNRDTDYKLYSRFQKGFLIGLTDSTIKHDYNKPINKSQEQEAFTQGLQLISRSTNQNYNYYKHSCGHSEFLQPTHVRRGNFKCSTCLHERFVNEANEKGFTYVYHLKNSTHVYIKPCSHIALMSTQSVRNSKVEKCLQCFEESLELACRENNYKYLGKIGEESGAFREIVFNSCGHSKIVHHCQIIKGNAVCRICVANGHKEAALEHGIVGLSDTEDYRYKLYELPCGHNKVLRVDHAKDGSYLCDTCENSHYTKPSKIYLFKMKHEDFSWLKLGFARNINVRKNNYGLIGGVESELIYEIPVDLGRTAIKIEKKLHRDFKEYRYPKNLMKKYHVNNGFTECYPVSTIELFKKEFENLKEVFYE